VAVELGDPVYRAAVQELRDVVAEAPTVRRWCVLVEDTERGPMYDRWRVHGPYSPQKVADVGGSLVSILRSRAWVVVRVVPWAADTPS
jgi:hypothetical protein